MEHTINTIKVPEGLIDFVTVVVGDYTLDYFEHRAGNAVVGTTFKPDWSSASAELEAFADTVLVWCSSIETMPHELEEYGYVLADEDDELITHQVSVYL
jgi:hypothetical protein